MTTSTPTASFGPEGPPTPPEGGRIAGWYALPHALGRYVLERELGSGGFGVVYEARQVEPVTRAVALKVIRPGMGTRSIVTRFEAERQALALMDHPSIARIYDGGISEDGNPYFVMELVRGARITDHCAARGIDLRGRVELMIPVCEAMHHAHTKGVVHRDLKPSNILVVDADGLPMPKIIDFGIAKALEQGALPGIDVTGEHRFVGTLEYASPEQAGIGPPDIDTRSDVYSLGVVLYELVTGRTPFEFASGDLRGVAEYQRILRDKDPARPSTRVVVPGGARVLPDLDWIVLRCLEKDRDRRYAGANELAADLRRLLADEPVAAGPPSAAYRVRKFVRRNRVAVAAAVVAVGALAAATAVSAWFAVEAARERRVAEQRLAEVERVAEFQRTMLGAATAERVGREVRDQVVREIGDAALRTGATEADAQRLRDRLSDQLRTVHFATIASRALDSTVLSPAEAAARERFSGSPLVLGAVLQGLAEAQASLGFRNRGLALMQEAVELRRASLGDTHRETLRAVSALARLHRITGGLLDAPTVESALRAARAHLDPLDPDLLSLALSLGTIMREADADRAEPLLLEARDGFEHRLGPDDERTIWAQLELGAFYRDRGDLDRSIPITRAAAERAAAVFGMHHEVTLYADRGWARLLRDQGDLDGAIALRASIVERRDRTFGPLHPASISELTSLMNLLGAAGDLEGARDLGREAIERAVQAFGEDHDFTAKTREEAAPWLGAE